MSRDADRNMVFGVVALQMNFIDRDQLIHGMQTWILDKSKTLSDILVEMNAMSGSDASLLNQMVDRHLEIHNGDLERSLAALSSLGSVEEALSRIDEPEVQRSLSFFSRAKNIRDREEVDHAKDEGSKAKDRFRVLRFHADGGLGKVSIALDTDLNREVALKEIQDAYARDQDVCERFLLEAEITGRLEHPGIVPVYGLGHRDDGNPFYAMRFVRGDSLKQSARRYHERKEELSVGKRAIELRKLLQRFIDVCNAVEYAHSRGVLHRDLKPGNVMLGKFGETLVVDWGLAKAVGRDEPYTMMPDATLQPRSGSGSAKTEMGRAIGTPSYMSPEQAAGRLEELGRASDVYSLGATLFYLLTNRAPIIEDNLELCLAKVQIGEFPSPREIDRSLSKGLEAICLKAMALKPVDRYESCADLASDVEKWLADEAVEAAPDPISQRARRWVRKHSRAVAVIVSSLLSFVVLLSIGMLVLGAKNEELKEARDVAVEAKNNADANARVAEENFGIAMTAVDEMLERVGGETLSEVPGTAKIRRELLTQARDFYLEILKKNQVDPTRSFEVVRVLGRMSFLEYYLDNLEASLKYSDECLEKLESLEPGQIDEGANLQSWITLHRFRGLAFTKLGQPEKARASFAEAVEINDAANEVVRQLVIYGHEYAQLLSDFGRLLNGLGEYDEARRLTVEAVNILEAIVDQHDDLESKRLLANALHDLAFSLSFIQDSRTEGLYLRALELRKQDSDPTLKSKWLKGRLLRDVALFYRSNHNLDKALEFAREAVTVHEQLSQTYPDIPRWQSEYASSLNAIAWVQMAQGESELALSAIEESVRLLENVIEAVPDNDQYQRQYDDLLNNLANWLRPDSGKLERLLEIQTKIRSIREKRVKEDPDNAENHSDLGAILHNIAMTNRARGEVEVAFRLVERAISEQEKAIRRNPQHREFSEYASNHSLLLARLNRDLGERDLALDAFDESISIESKRFEQRQRPEDAGRLAARLAESSMYRALDELQLDRALTDARRAVEIMPESLEFSRVFAECSLGFALARQKEFPSAITHLAPVVESEYDDLRYIALVYMTEALLNVDRGEDARESWEQAERLESNFGLDDPELNEVLSRQRERIKDLLLVDGTGD